MSLTSPDNISSIAKDMKPTPEPKQQEKRESVSISCPSPVWDGKEGVLVKIRGEEALVAITIPKDYSGEKDGYYKIWLPFPCVTRKSTGKTLAAEHAELIERVLQIPKEGALQ